MLELFASPGTLELAVMAVKDWFVRWIDVG